jgi:hypothetical protein
MLFCWEILRCVDGIHSKRANFFKAVHILLTITAFRPASGLRLEIALNIDKKKPEFYFLLSIKKILTEKPNGHRPKHENLSGAHQVDRKRWRAHFPSLRP